MNEYAKKYESINISILPEAFVSELNEVYKLTEGFKNDELVDVFSENFNFLYNLISEQYPEAVGWKEADPKPPKAPPKEPKAPKVPVPKPPKPPKVPKARTPKPPLKANTQVVISPDELEHLPEDVRLLKRFLGFCNKEKSKEQILHLYKDFNRRIIERKVNLKSSNKDLIEEVFEKVATLHEKAKSNRIFIKVDKSFIDEIIKVVEENQVRYSVNLLKRFVSLEGTKKDVKKAQTLVNSIEKAIESSIVKKGDRYIENLKTALKSLKSYISGKADQVSISPAGLSGLGIIDLPAELLEIFKNIDEPATGNAISRSFILPTDLGRFLGKIERMEYALLLRGNKGAGKTRLLYQLLNLFSSQKLTIAHFSLEVSKNSDLVTRHTETYIAENNKKYISISDEAPNGINTIREAAKYFDVVAIDSFTKLNVKQTEFDKLRKDFPSTFFIIIFQSTTAGTARGGSAAEFDAGAVLQVNDGGMAFFEKNRYDTDDSRGLVYNLNTQSFV